MKTILTKWKWWRVDAAGLGVCVVLALAFFLGGLLPLMRRHEGLTARQSELAAQRARGAKLKVALAVARSQLDAVGLALAESPLRLRPVSNVNRVLAEISNLAGTSGLNIHEIRPGPASAGAHYGTVPIVLAGSGRFPTCVVFLHRLRKALPDTSVSGLELAANEAEPLEPGTFRFDLQWHAAPMPSPAPR